jgi:hypothetical protein
MFPRIDHSQKRRPGITMPGMTQREIERELKRLRNVVNGLAFNMEILASANKVLTEELGDALRRQGIDPKPFLDRLTSKTSAMASKHWDQNKLHEAKVEELKRKYPEDFRE